MEYQDRSPDNGTITHFLRNSGRWGPNPQLQLDFAEWMLRAALGLFSPVGGERALIQVFPPAVRHAELYADLYAERYAGGLRVLPPMVLLIRGARPEYAGSYTMGPGFQVVVSDTARRGYRTMRLA